MLQVRYAALVASSLEHLFDAQRNGVPNSPRITSSTRQLQETCCRSAVIL
jgi:hypothetical protein